ncbi:unnamed protein product, partial [marine sediment metagenome]
DEMRGVITGIFKLDNRNIYSCALSYRIASKLAVRIQADFFDTKILLSNPKTSIKIEMIAISTLGIFDLVSYQNYVIYSGIGLTSHQVKTLWVKGPNAKFPWDIYNFGFPSGVTVLLGFTNSLPQSYCIRAELQYTVGTKGQLLSVPLDWNGFKFLVGVGIKI